MRGVTFGNNHSYREWGLLLKEYPYISPPEPKTKLIEVPGSDAVIDLTESLTGKVHYGMREGRFEFWVIGGRSKWPAIYSAIMNELHGKRVKIVLDDDPNWYYLGRVRVDEMASDKVTATIVLTAELEPYKRARHGEGRRL
jgi:hypothetical protein